MSEQFDISQAEKLAILQARKEKEKVIENVGRNNTRDNTKESPKDTTEIRRNEIDNGNVNGKQNIDNKDNSFTSTKEIETFEIVKHDDKEKIKDKKEETIIRCGNCDTRFKVEDEDIPLKCPKCDVSWQS